jgi:hypothetical protein
MICGTPEFNRQQKVRAAIEKMGERYVFHPANAVKKAPNKTPEIARTDVAKTFKRIRERINATAGN